MTIYIYIYIYIYIGKSDRGCPCSYLVEGLYIQCQPKETERLLLIGKMSACTLNGILAENLVMDKYFSNMMP